MESSDDPGFIGYCDPAGFELFADTAVIEHCRESSGVGSAGASGAGSAVVGGFVGVIEADGAVSEDEEDVGEIADESDIAEGAFGEVDHFGEGEANAFFMGSGGSAFGSFETEPGDGGWCNDASGGAINSGGLCGEENACEEGDGCEGSEDSGEESSCDGGAAAGVDALGGASEESSGDGALSMGIFEGVDDVFHDPVFGCDDDGAECGPCGFGSSAVVHRNAKESGVPECFDIGAGFFEMSAEGFFAGIDAGDDLESGFGGFELG